MASFPNLFAAEVRRLRNDETGEIVLLFTRDGAPMDISGMAFSIGYCQVDTVEEEMRFTIGKATDPVVSGAELTRPANTTDRLVLDINPANRTELDQDSYTAFVYEVKNGKRDPMAVILHKWLEKAEAFVEGLPKEPAALQLNFITAGENIVLLSVYEVPTSGSINIVYVNEAAALAASLGEQPFRLIKAGNFYFIKEADGLIPLVTMPKITA
ncbi:hypothetical protein [Fibrella forsythiae]|uniref:Uncharacterized protein n=1 Tax=Fibrella forsythiae TaxID=2817061 RepID=A0ABS3JAD9_9BACT|nr:hypothetical protein [Fibrella forsythiae]MBO0946958.1 hypothetical protein [Fibrella forsythiae]